MNIETDYFEAREKFVAAAERAGLRTSRVRVPFEDQPELFIDFAFEKRDPARALLQISGVHGIEGFAGSMIQRRVLEDLPSGGPSLLFVHAMNPYGMALYRRANGSNVDLNRSVHDGKIENPDYRYFDTYLNPKSGLEFYTGLVKAFSARLRLGENRTRQAVAAGQIEFPHGLFYAGSGLQREVKLFAEFLRTHFREASEITALDIHTGLGDWKGEMLFVDEDREVDAPEYFEKIFGRKMSLADPSEGAYANFGRFSDSIRTVLPRVKLHYCLQEFGTHPASHGLRALRRENFEWRFRQAGTPPPDWVKREMLEAFLPADASWRENMVELGVRRWKECFAAMLR